jgi:hypothetical protein
MSTPDSTRFEISARSPLCAVPLPGDTYLMRITDARDTLSNTQQAMEKVISGIDDDERYGELMLLSLFHSAIKHAYLLLEPDEPDRSAKPAMAE